MGCMVRPEVSEEVIQEVESLTDGDFAVADTKVSFEDRVKKLTQKYERLEKRANSSAPRRIDR
jgi:hypothetical protein